jgi:beta-mannosidase
MDGLDLPERWLSGVWRAAPADEELRRGFADPTFRDDAWEPMAVPSHWRSSPAFATTDGPLLYRTAFDSATVSAVARPDDRTWLVLDGVFYTSDVWLDGSYVGDTEGYFFPHKFDITEAIADRRDHVLALEVGCPPQTDRTRKRNLTGVFQHWDLLDQDWNPGGIWRPVRLERTGPVTIRHLRVLCRDARTDAATIFVRAVVDTLDAQSVELRTTIRELNGPEVMELTSDRQLAAGENRLEWTVTVANPRLWWPWSLGEQPRYEVTVDVATDSGTSDRRTRRLGLRRVSLRNWIFSINGERLFLKGANQGPTKMALADATVADFVGDLHLARGANLDFLRLHAHVSRPELYEVADEVGMLLWQDLPLQWGYARGVRAQARRQAREAVDLLAHHPSVVLWCGHNKPIALDITPEKIVDDRSRARLFAREMVGQLFPTWNKSVLDHSIASVLEKTDGSRPVIPHSGVLPHPPQLDGTDSHWYLGWSHGEERDLPRLLRWWPRVGRFVSEFGAQAVPADAGFLEPRRWPELDWASAARNRSLQRPFFDRHVPPDDHATFEAWQDATQRYQAALIGHQVHALRLLKYRPCGGFALFCFADGHPSVTFSVLGHDRSPKLGYDALAAACAPVIIVATRLEPILQAGAPLHLDVHVVNDRHISNTDMLAVLHLDWRRHDQDRHLTWRWQGDLTADGCERIGTIDTVVPAADGRLTVRVELRDHDDELVARSCDHAPVRT